MKKRLDPEGVFTISKGRDQISGLEPIDFGDPRGLEDASLQVFGCIPDHRLPGAGECWPAHL